LRGSFVFVDEVGPSFHFIPCFFIPFLEVLLLTFGWQGFIRCEASEYNESEEKKKNEGEGCKGDILGVLSCWNNALAQWCFGNSTFGIFRKPELALPRSSFFNPYTNVHHNPPLLRIPKSSASFLA
jgi:hypothetical protein